MILRYIKREIARAMREAGDFLINYKPTGDE